MFVDGASADDSTHDPTGEARFVERRVLALRFEVGRIEYPRCIGVDHDDVGRRAGAKRASDAARQSIATNPAVDAAVEKGATWLASVQGADGGWGQDGGDPSNVRADVPLETTGNDVANTALAALALLRAGSQYRPNVERAVDFILKRVESSSAEGLAIAPVDKQSQVQRKLGP